MVAERCSFRSAVALVAVLALLLAPSDARAGSVDTNDPFTLITGKLIGKGDAEALFIFSHEDQKLAIYLVEGDTLKLLFVRDCKKDFDLKASFGKTEPKPSEVKKRVRGPKPAPPKDDGAKKDDKQPVSKQAPVGTTGKFTLALGRPQGFGEADAIYIWSHDRKRLNIYLIRNDTLELLFTRNCTYDFELESAGKQKPKMKMETVAHKDD